MFSGRWEGGNTVTLSSFSVVNSCLSDVKEGEFIFKAKKVTLMSVSRGFEESSERVKRKMFGPFP